MLIDDPVRSREDADSVTSRERAWEWYRSDLLTQLKPGGRVVLIQTRWHEDDLAGGAMANPEAAGRSFRVVRLPMEAEDDDPLGRVPGALLWPEYFTPEMAAEARRDARTWTALYQQRPAPEEGNYSKDEWLPPIDRMPAASDLRVYGNASRTSGSALVLSLSSSSHACSHLKSDSYRNHRMVAIA